jgi:hypothetical protein
LRSVSLSDSLSLRSKALRAAQQLHGSNDLQLAAVSNLLVITSRKLNPLHFGMYAPIAHQAFTFLLTPCGSTPAQSLVHLDKLPQFANKKKNERRLLLQLSSR